MIYSDSKYTPCKVFTLKLQKAFRLIHNSWLKQHEFLILFASYNFKLENQVYFTIDNLRDELNHHFSRSGIWKIVQTLTEKGFLIKKGKIPERKGRPAFFYNTTNEGNRLVGEYLDYMV